MIFNQPLYFIKSTVFQLIGSILPTPKMANCPDSRKLRQSSKFLSCNLNSKSYVAKWVVQFWFYLPISVSENVQLTAKHSLTGT